VKFQTSIAVFAVSLYAAYVDGCSPMLWDSPSVPWPRVKQSKNNAGNRWKHSYVGDSVGFDWFSGKVGKPERLEHGWKVRTPE